MGRTVFQSDGRSRSKVTLACGVCYLAELIVVRGTKQDKPRPKSTDLGAQITSSLGMTFELKLNEGSGFQKIGRWRGPSG